MYLIYLSGRKYISLMHELLHTKVTHCFTASKDLDQNVAVSTQVTAQPSVSTCGLCFVVNSKCMYFFFLLISDSVVRTSYYKYFHPKECLISNGVLNRYETIVSRACLVAAHSSQFKISFQIKLLIRPL